MVAENAQTETQTHVWQAARPLRLFTYIALTVVLLLAIRVLMSFGYLAIIGVALVLAAAGQVWWMVLRPSLTAGPDGVDVVLGRAPVHLEWRDIRSAEAGPNGIRITCANGREVRSRFPQTDSRTPAERSEATRVASFLAQRAAWERRPSGAEPRYRPPAP